MNFFIRKPIDHGTERKLYIFFCHRSKMSQQTFQIRDLGIWRILIKTKVLGGKKITELKLDNSPVFLV